MRGQGDTMANGLSELEAAKAEMDYRRRFGGFGYKQAKRHYERVLRRSRWTKDAISEK